MATKKLINEFMEKILNDLAWTGQMLEKHKNKMDWKAISNNIIWTPAMLDKFRKFKDWQ